jgi:photosystem II stability/assembly factor-like uncharacterized protein
MAAVTRPRRSTILLLFTAVALAPAVLAVTVGAAPVATPALGVRVDPGAAERVAPRTLDPFTAMDFVSATRGWATRGWAVSLEANVRTTDGGATWKQFALPGDMRYDPQAVDFVTAKVGFIVGIDGGQGLKRAVVLKSTNGGASWTVKKRFGSFDLLAGVCFVNTQKGWVVGRGGRIFTTTNGGTSWKAQSSKTTKTLYAIKFADASHGWAVGAGGTVVRTSNGGQKWSAKSITAADLYSIDFVNQARGWAAGASGLDAGDIRATSNGGKVWKQQGSGLGSALAPVGSIDFFNKDHGVAGGYFGMLLYTEDGGATWQAASAPGVSGLAVVGVKLLNEKLGFAACNNYTIVRTADGGKTWTTVLAPQPMR